MIRSGLLATFAIFMAVVTACAPSAPPDAPVQSPLQTATPTPTDTPTPVPTATPTPIPTPTPPPTIADPVPTIQGRPPNFTPPVHPGPLTPEPAPPRRRRGEDVWRDRIPKIQGTPLEMPPGACNDGIIVETHGTDEGIRPLEMPFYQIIYKGEVAYVSKVTGHFEIGENQQETFQFLIDALGQDRVVLLPDSIYEDNWSHERQKALDEGC